MSLARQYVLYDTEFTAWPGSAERNWSRPDEHREVIQLAALRIAVHARGIKIISSFNELVVPQINPKLSDYIIELTGISQSTLDDMGVDFCSALSAFYQFCEQGALPCCAWGKDDQVLAENCDLANIALPVFQAGFFNLKQWACDLSLPGCRLNSGELAASLNIPLSGHNHNALFDVKSMSAALNVWLSKGLISPNDFPR